MTDFAKAGSTRLLHTPATRTILDCNGLTTREINQQLKAIAATGQASVTLLNPAGRHNLAVGLETSMLVGFEGSVGYYCGGLSEHANLDIQGNCGWSVGENLMSGQIVVRGDASANAAATARGGKICVLGNAGARAGISLKGATLIVLGNVGSGSAFMMQQGCMIVCGDAGANLADSIYEGEIFVGGAIASLGADAQIEPLTDADWQMLDRELGAWNVKAQDYAFKKVVCAKQLYNFKPRDFTQEKLI
jgi:methylamine---glutamate N-methyltransferase subunit B